jgi:hypothetical protein
VRFSKWRERTNVWVRVALVSGAVSALSAGCDDETLGRSAAPPEVEEDAGDSAIDPGGGSSGTAGAPASGGTGAAG